MGCVHSRHDINDQHANIFQVVNVDDLGHRFSAAMLEVTDAHLVLHQRGRAATRWPLRCLRRYGFDADLFSFESGRRCPTGPGIYAFRCRRAEALFNMLQLQIQNITEDAASRDMAVLPMQMVPEGQELIHSDSHTSGAPGATDPEGYLRPLPHSRIINNVGVTAVGANASGVSSGGGATGGIASGTGNAVSYVERVSNATVCGIGTLRSPNSPPSPPPVPCENNHDPSQTEPPPSSVVQEIRDTPPSPTEPVRPLFVNHINKIVTYENHVGRQAEACGNSYPERSLLHGNSIQPKMPRSYENLHSNKSHFEVNDQLYVNIGRERDDHLYVNLGTKTKDAPAVPPRPSLAQGSAGSGSSQSGTTTTTDTQINYCILDLDHGSDSSQAAPLSPLESVTSGPESPHRITERYATIDFGRTDALSNTAKAAPWEDGSRRTRHNSTFTSPQSLIIRHNSSLSD